MSSPDGVKTACAHRSPRKQNPATARQVPELVGCSRRNQEVAIIVRELEGHNLIL